MILCLPENTYTEVLLYSNFPATAGLTNATITRVFCATYTVQEADGARFLAITLVMQESIPGICAAEVEALRAEEIDGQRGRGAVSVLRLPRNTGQR